MRHVNEIKKLKVNYLIVITSRFGNSKIEVACIIDQIPFHRLSQVWTVWFFCKVEFFSVALRTSQKGIHIWFPFESRLQAYLVPITRKIAGILFRLVCPPKRIGVFDGGTWRI